MNGSLTRIVINCLSARRARKTKPCLSVTKELYSTESSLPVALGASLKTVSSRYCLTPSSQEVLLQPVIGQFDALVDTVPSSDGRMEGINVTWINWSHVDVGVVVVNMRISILPFVRMEVSHCALSTVGTRLELHGDLYAVSAAERLAYEELLRLTPG